MAPGVVATNARAEFELGGPPPPEGRVTLEALLPDQGPGTVHTPTRTHGLTWGEGGVRLEGSLARSLPRGRSVSTGAFGSWAARPWVLMTT